MRELTMMEISEVSGGGFFSRIGAMGLGGITGLISGIAKGAVVGGAQGGLLGVGLITGCAGMIIGGVISGVAGVIYGAINDEKQTTKLFNSLMENIFDWLSPTPK
ncbi:hypothetical protein LIG30_1218 [Burkholderia sp. lig30]|jgi:hypothetical protein|uniref:hypothetical protein n=1 Tax=Burkholderia sp. lig30 TaxID=1192124 RepID=UPI00046132E7|nr:hypothetical protein [Burkholderia sp. lig30]KDB10016.1 hypothetical protein LIG30_1218 [Burkholderia sp. lig30]